MKIRSGLTVGRRLGDWVAHACRVTGAAESAARYTRVTGKDCGCEKRKEILNWLTPVEK